MDLNVLVSTNFLATSIAPCPNCSQIHSTGFFLPWHRLFVQTFEDELKSKCGYDGVQPYWDWTRGKHPCAKVVDFGFD